MDDLLNTIQHGDCIERMNALPEGCVDLAFADPPFNIGYEYDVYDDRKEAQQYLDWSRDWIAAVHRVLKDDGTFWLAIGDEYAAELKLISQQAGFTCRSWVIWYYTFGVNCSHKFSRSHAHLFHFVKNPEKFTFRSDAMENRIPSARQLVYGDKRANPKGRLPDDTWILRPVEASGQFSIEAEELIAAVDHGPSDEDATWTLRPQDVEHCFSEGEDTWYFPRVAGTFKERAGFHGCQMPEQLLGRIIRFCSDENEVVLDPFSGSATTLAVAKKLGRKFIGFDLSEEYIRHGRSRLDAIRVGDRLDGAAEPLVSAPKTTQGTRRVDGKRVVAATPKKKKGGQKSLPLGGDPVVREAMFEDAQRNLTLHGIVEAFRLTHNGYSADRLVADPELNATFVDACSRLGLVGDARVWNSLLFRIRKAGKLSQFPASRVTTMTWEDCDEYLFASEIAYRQMMDRGIGGLDAVLCDPELATEFDQIAASFAPGRSSLEYRWAALKLRKEARFARTRGASLSPDKLSISAPVELGQLSVTDVPESSGMYLVRGESSDPLYVGETLNLRRRLSQFDVQAVDSAWNGFAGTLRIEMAPTGDAPPELLAWQSRLARHHRPKLNIEDFWAAT
ncbi:MAG: DNA-methyltransferase [Planctomycetota bacterium]